MAQIVIQDLAESAELDEAAMREVFGGRAVPGYGRLEHRPLSLLDERFTGPDSVLPTIGLGTALLGGKKLL